VNTQDEVLKVQKKKKIKIFFFRNLEKIDLKKYLYSLYNMGRKNLNRTPEEIRERKKNWAKNNPDKIYEYNRKSLLDRCITRNTIPCKKTIERYNYTTEELQPLFDNLFGAKQI